MSKNSEIDLTPETAAGMTVNERLFHAGLTESFDKAIAEQNRKEVKTILEKVYLSSENIEVIVKKYIEN